MPDLLVKLYNLPNNWQDVENLRQKGVSIRKPIGPEKRRIVSWVGKYFNEGWSSEADVALSNQPVSCFIAEKANELLGFACYDATVLGFFGPTGVSENARGQGIGKALLMAVLTDMRLKGYGYAVIGDAGPVDFYKSNIGAIEIPDSYPGVYRGMIK